MKSCAAISLLDSPWTRQMIISFSLSDTDSVLSAFFIMFDSFVEAPAQETPAETAKAAEEE